MSRFGLVILLACSTAGVAAAPEHHPVTNKDLIELTDIDSPSISPDGRFAVFRTYRADVGTNEYVVRWHAIDLAAGTVKDIGTGGEPIYDDPGLIYPAKVVWNDNSKAIITRALIDGAIGLWRADVEGHGMTPLVVSDANVIDFSLTKDGSALDYTVGATRDAIKRAETREKDSGILVDSTVDLTQSLFRSAWVNGRMASQRLVGYWWVRNGLLWRAPRQEHRFDLQTGEDQPIGLPKAVPPFDPTKVLAFDTPTDADGDVASDSWDGKSYSLLDTLKDHETIQCVDPICKSSSVSTLSSIPGTNDFLIAFKDRERRQSLYRWSPRARQLKFLASAEGLLNGGRYDYYPCAVSGETALCIESGPASPPRVESLNLKSGERQVLFDPNSRLRIAYHPRVRFFDWSIGGGRSVGGVLMLPSDGVTGRAPLYLNYYTCDGFLRGGTGNEWPVSELLASGYAILCMNSVPVYGPQHPVFDYSIALQATQTAIDLLAGEGIIDRSKVVMGGLSFGSEAALWIAVHSHLLSALSISSGQFEPATYWQSSMPGSNITAIDLKVWGLGDPELTAGRWKIVSPALSADKIRIPVLFQLPEQEAREIPELYAQLYREGTPTELYAFPDEDHLKIEPRHLAAVYERNFDWFQYWLENVRDPDPAKIEQYRRWDALRARWNHGEDARAKSQSKAQAPPSR